MPEHNPTEKQPAPEKPEEVRNREDELNPQQDEFRGCPSDSLNLPAPVAEGGWEEEFDKALMAYIKGSNESWTVDPIKYDWNKETTYGKFKRAIASLLAEAKKKGCTNGKRDGLKQEAESTDAHIAEALTTFKSDLSEKVKGMLIINSLINGCSCENCLIEMGTEQYNRALSDVLALINSPTEE